jgi:ABC-type antimicrobial peptide transport system permease subunit
LWGAGRSGSFTRPARRATSRTPASNLLRDAEAATVTGRRRWRSVLRTGQMACLVVLLVVFWLFVLAADAVRRITATRRFNGMLMSGFGLVGLLIRAAGVFAVMASFVAQQTREIGVRLALGATPARIQRAVLSLAWRHGAADLALGVPMAWWLSRGFAALLFRVTPADVSVYAGVAALLTAVALIAAWIPARRAATIDPIKSLRR